MVEILYPVLIIVALCFGGIIFSQELVAWRLAKQSRKPNIKIALNGATVHAPPNITGKVMSISRFAHDTEKMVIEILDTTTNDVCDIVAGRENIKPYTIEGSLLNKENTIFVINVDENGKVYDDYMGVDFTANAINKHIAILEKRVLSQEKMLNTTIVSPMDKQHFYENSELFSHIDKFRQGAKEQQGVPAGTTQIFNTPPKDEDEESS